MREGVPKHKYPRNRVTRLPKDRRKRNRYKGNLGIQPRENVLKKKKYLCLWGLC